jgi:hypothetical protein
VTNPSRRPCANREFRRQYPAARSTPTSSELVDRKRHRVCRHVPPRSWLHIMVIKPLNPTAATQNRPYGPAECPSDPSAIRHMSSRDEHSRTTHSHSPHPARAASKSPAALPAVKVGSCRRAPVGVHTLTKALPTTECHPLGRRRTYDCCRAMHRLTTTDLSQFALLKSPSTTRPSPRLASAGAASHECPRGGQRPPWLGTSSFSPLGVDAYRSHPAVSAAPDHNIPTEGRLGIVQICISPRQCRFNKAPSLLHNHRFRRLKCAHHAGITLQLPSGLGAIPPAGMPKLCSFRADRTRCAVSVGLAEVVLHYDASAYGRACETWSHHTLTADRV